MKHRTLVLLLKVSLTCGWLACAPEARAADPVAECIAANERSLDLRDHGKLLDARGQVALCAASTCPDPIQQACRGRMGELNGAIPSIVFDVKDAAGRDLMDVRLSVDGQPAGTVGVTALQVDPGQHTFRFEAAGQPAVERNLVLREGEMDKRETIVIGPTEQVIVKSSGNGQRMAGWIAGGVGVAAMGASGVLALVAKSSYEGASGCSGTTCKNQDGITATDRARDLGTVATLVLVAGAAVTAGGAILWLTAPKTEAVAVKQASWGVGLTVGGALLQGRF